VGNHRDCNKRSIRCNLSASPKAFLIVASFFEAETSIAATPSLSEVENYEGAQTSHGAFRTSYSGENVMSLNFGSEPPFLLLAQNRFDMPVGHFPPLGRKP